MLSNKTYLCIVDYHSKFLVVKQMDRLSADSLIITCEITFSGYGIPSIKCLMLAQMLFLRVAGIMQVPEYPSGHIIIIKLSE